MRLGMVMLVWLAGCGFERTLPDDGGTADLSDVDGGGDDASSADGGPANIGPGPLGALPAGFCCKSDEDCRSRACVHAGNTGPMYCLDRCNSTNPSVCTNWGAALMCQSGGGSCVAVDETTFTCLDPSTFTHGTKQTGSCCDPIFDGQDCLGGLCTAVGIASNPYYCTQGCDGDNGCPDGYNCNALHWCDKNDPWTPYTCNP